MPLGLALAVSAESAVRPLRWFSFLVVEVGRGLPALVLLYLLYFGLPEAGIVLTSMHTAVAALAWASGAYASEYFRAGLSAVPREQKEAALVTGLGGWQGFRLIVLPQALRISMPPLASLAVLTFQASALAFIIAVPELMSNAYELSSMTFKYLSVYVLTAGIYSIITLIFLMLTRRVETYLNRHL